MSKQYRVEPFVPKHSNKGPVSLREVADQMEYKINEMASNHFKFVGLETVSSHVPAKGGCFGFFKDAPYDVTFHYLVFERDWSIYFYF